MMPVFADTYYFLAFLSPQDAGHARAMEVASAIHAPVVTTAWVITELADGCAAPLQRRRFINFYQAMLADRTVRIVQPTPQLFARAMDLYASRPDKGWSLTDCASFVVMRRHNLKEALTADHHFEQAGFAALLR